MLKLIALAVTAGLASAASVSAASDAARRAAQVREVLASVPVPESLTHRRRLIETHGKSHADSKESIVEIMDERTYFMQQSVAINTLRSLGFEEHELPATGGGGLHEGHGKCHLIQLSSPDTHSQPASNYILECLFPPHHTHHTKLNPKKPRPPITT